MDFFSLQGSEVSLTESEASTTSKSSKQAAYLGNFTHNYNTRLSVKNSAILPLKNLYVDLSNSRVQSAVSDYPQITRRRDSCSSDDSREFDFSYCGNTEPLTFKMDARNPCNTYRSRSNWLKYFVSLSVMGLLFVYIQHLHNAESIRKIHKEMDKIKLNIDDSSRKLSRVESALNNMKYQQDKTLYDLKSVISEAIDKFGSDKTGKTDYALESTGGKIVQLSPGTENFEQAVTLFGMTLCDGKHGPRAMIQADMSPGNCWALKGSNGGAIIKLLGNVKIDSVSLEHISKSLSPTGDVSSAPKNFSVWGLRNPSDRGHPLGEFSYSIKGSLVQTFHVSNSNYYEFVEFRVLSNQGNPDFTCVYRFRVHGLLEKQPGKM